VDRLPDAKFQEGCIVEIRMKHLQQVDVHVELKYVGAVQLMLVCVDVRNNIRLRGLQCKIEIFDELVA